MLVNLYQKFVNIDGAVFKDINVIKDEEGVTTKMVNDLTLEKVIKLALAEPMDQKISGDTKIKCFDLLLQVMAHKDGAIELKSEDITFIKNLIKPKFPVLIVGEAMHMLEGKDIGIDLLENNAG